MMQSYFKWTIYNVYTSACLSSTVSILQIDFLMTLACHELKSLQKYIDGTEINTQSNTNLQQFQREYKVESNS